MAFSFGPGVEKQRMVNDDVVRVHVPDECDAWPGGGRGCARSFDYQRRVACNPGGRDNVVYVVMEAKVSKYQHYLHYASFVLDGDVAYLVAFSTIAVNYEDDTEDAEVPTIYDFLVGQMMHDRRLRVPESMRPRMHPSHCDVVFYDRAEPFLSGARAGQARP